MSDPMATSAPALASASAAARPIPVTPPVIQAARPERNLSVIGSTATEEGTVPHAREPFRPRHRSGRPAALPVPLVTFLYGLLRRGRRRALGEDHDRQAGHDDGAAGKLVGGYPFVQQQHARHY